MLGGGNAEEMVNGAEQVVQASVDHGMRWQGFLYASLSPTGRRAIEFEAWR